MLSWSWSGSDAKSAVWETEDWTRIVEPAKTGQQTLFSPDGTRILILSRRGNEQSYLIFWGVDEDEVILDRRQLGTAWISDMCFTRDGEELITIDEEGTLRVIEVPTPS